MKLDTDNTLKKIDDISIEYNKFELFKDDIYKNIKNLNNQKINLDDLIKKNLKKLFLIFKMEENMILIILTIYLIKLMQ